MIMRRVAVSFAAMISVAAMPAVTSIDNAPPLNTVTVPTNMMLTLSVEYPTGNLAGYKGIADNVTGYVCGGQVNSMAVCYVDSSSDFREYIGIFDPRKCYDYDGNPNSAINQLISNVGVTQAQNFYPSLVNSISGGASPGYFYPVSLVNGITNKVATGDGTSYFDTSIKNGHKCGGQTNSANSHPLWSGNYLNWASMGAVDEFRAILTGGDRVVDTATTATATGITVLEKAYETGQGGTGYFPTHEISNAAINTGTPPGGSSNFSVGPNNPSDYTPYPSGGKLYAIAMNPSNSNPLTAPFQATDSTGSNVTNQGGVVGADLSTNGGNNAVTELDATNVTDTLRASQGRAIEFATDSGFTKYVRTYMIRVKVCDSTLLPTVPLESNCQAYTNGTNTTYKPVGLIQQNISNLRVGAAGYLLDNNRTRPGGVIRARLHDIGQTTIVPNGTGVSNTQADIDANGVFLQHPDLQDETDSNNRIKTANGGTAPSGAPFVNYSGAINYLNKFGKQNGYKTYDTVSEMFYEALRYIHLAPGDDGTSNGTMTINGKQTSVRMSTPEYTNALPLASPPVGNLTTSMYDGFPIITDWHNDDPLEWYCQKNVFVGIADSNTHCDSMVPGYVAGDTAGTGSNPNTGPSSCSRGYLDPKRDTLIYGGSTATNQLLAAFQAMDANEQIAATNNSGQTSTQTFENRSDSNNNTYGTPGLAYWANVNDIRPTFPGKPQGSKITAQSYWLDVMESGIATGSSYYLGWQYLAGKYGGFTNDGHQITLPSGSVLPQYPAPDSKTSWENTTTNEPNNYFPANRPDYMKAGLQQIFGQVAGTIQTSAGATLGSTQITSSTTNAAFVSQYNPSGWYSTELLGEQLSANVITGVPSTSLVWDAAGGTPNLDSQAAGYTSGSFSTDNENGRRIVTMGSSGAGVPFRYANLTSAQQTAIGSDAILRYLRGDRSNEIGQPSPAVQTYRQRTHLLGDIIDSEARYIGPPNAGFGDAGYSAFATSYANREPAIYVGANDGMLHVFDADVTTGTTKGGKELWAYVPSFVYGTSTTNGIAYLSNPNYQHRYFVDQTPQTNDVDFCNTKGQKASPTSGTPCASGGAGYWWHTIVVGGLNKGGTGYYALDVTTPGTTSDSETTVATRVLWEFTDADMGYTYGYPIIVKTAQYGWVVLLTSGYNNLSGPAADQGVGYLYILDAYSGKLIQKISTGVGSATTPSNLGRGRAFIQNSTNYVADYAYYGDMLGNVWRFDLTTASGAYPAPALFAQLTDPSGVAQPITSQPAVDVDVDGIERYVFFGTGQMLAQSDLTSTQQQTFYALRDGTLTTVSSATAPLTRASLTQLYSAEITAGTGAIAAGTSGWFYDLGGLDEGSERIVEDVTSNAGLVAFATLTPSKTNVCSPGGTGAGYTLVFATGKSVITNASGQTLLNFSSQSPVLKPQFVDVNGAAIREYYTTSSGQIDSINGNFGGTGQPSRMYWKEIFN